MEKDDEKFFYEDEVATVSPKNGLIKYGLVLTTNRSRTEMELKKMSFKSPNDIKVIWHPNGNEEVLSEDKVVLVDRSLVPGDVVRKVNEDKLIQFGYCENIDIYATVKVLNTNKVIENVSCRNFTQTKPFSIDSSVFYESWVGGVYDVKCLVTFASQDGSIFTLKDPYRQDFISLSTSDSFSLDDNVFYHGQKLKMCLDSLENAKFIKVSNMMNYLWHNYKKKNKYGTKWIKVYVQDINVSSVEVEWYCQTYGKTKPRDEQWPERIISGENLKKLKTIDLFDSCSIQVGDTHWYQIKDSDSILTMKQWRAKCTKGFSSESELPINKLRKNNNTKKMHLTKTKGSSDEMDNMCNQNIINKTGQIMQRSDKFGNRENKQHLGQIKNCESRPSFSNLSNNSVHTLKSNRLKRNRMWKSLVKKSKQLKVPKVSTKPNSKVVVEVCFTRSVVDVVWQDGTKETGVPSVDLYPIQTLDDLEFFPGDFVIEKNPLSNSYGVIESVDHTQRTACVQWFKVNPDNPSLPSPVEKADCSVYELRDHPDFHFKSGCLIIHISPDSYPNKNNLTAGQVLSAGSDGKVLVMWVNGEKTKCWPQELFVVKLHDDDAFSFLDDEFDDDDDDDEVEDAPLAGDDDLSEDWVSLKSPDSLESCNRENNQKIPKMFVESLKKALAGMKSFVDALVHNQDVDKITELHKAFEEIKLGFNVNSFLSSESEEIELCYKDFMDNFTIMVDKMTMRIENKTEITSEEHTLIIDSVDKLKKTVSDFIDKVNKAFKISYGSNNLSGYSASNLFDEKKQFQDSVIGSGECNPEVELEYKENNKDSECAETTCEIGAIIKPEEAGVFTILDSIIEESHKYSNDKSDLNVSMLKIISKDIQILKKSLPAGIWVKTFENRMDLFSIMISGPEKTPYHGGLFMFDVKLPATYPHQPPLCHYYSYCDDRLNPNLYEDGKVCLSLLGTWSGQGVELWSPKDSNLLQLLVSIQGLILVNEPYYNEAGFDLQRGQKLAKENSRVYNEMALIKVVQSMTNMLKTKLLKEISSTEYFDEEILEHVKIHGPRLINSIQTWIKISEHELSEDEKNVPGFPLLPLSKGFCLSVSKAIEDYKDVLMSLNIIS